MNYAETKLALSGLSREEQIEKLKESGYPEAEISDFLNFLFNPAIATPKQPEKSSIETAGSFMDSPLMRQKWARTQERLGPIWEQERLNPKPPDENELTPFKRDILHNQYIMGASTIHDDASYHNPKLRKTDSLLWMRHEFHGSGSRFALLLGDTGGGKTFSALAYANMISDVEIYDGKILTSRVRFVHAYKIAEMLTNSRKHADELDALTKSSILILDDLGAEPVDWRGKAFENHFNYLIDVRYRFKRKTILTSNTTREGFKELYGPRIVSRFNEIGLFFDSKEADLRQNGGSPQ